MKTCLATLLLFLSMMGCTTTTTSRLHLPPPQTVSHVDLERYPGTWYEIASFPQRFQRGCTATTATYALGKDGLIDVDADYAFAVVGHPNLTSMASRG